jgi:hypothetical protein
MNKADLLTIARQQLSDAIFNASRQVRTVGAVYVRFSSNDASAPTK